MNKIKADLSIIILNWNEFTDTRRCIDSIVKYVNSSYEIIIIDNGSNQREKNKLKHFIDSLPSEIKLIVLWEEKNHGVGPGRNIGAKSSNGNYLLFLDNDAFFDEPIDLSREVFEQKFNSLKSIGQLSFQLTNMDGTRQYNQRKVPSLAHPFIARILPQRLFKNYINKIEYRNIEFKKNMHEVDWSIGAFQIFDKNTFFKVGGFNNSLIYGHEDFDIGMRLRYIGYRNMTINYKTIKHVYKRRQKKLSMTTIKWLLFFYKVVFIAKFKNLGQLIKG